MSSVAERASRVTSTLIDHIAQVDLRVLDVDQAIAFYEGVVGLPVLERSAQRAVFGVDQRPLLTVTSEGVSAPADPRATGLFHTAIRFPTRPDLGDALARLANAGFEIGAGDHLVSEALYVDDPAGNGVELYWDRPQGDWPAPTDDMLVPMATLPVDLRGLLDDGAGNGAVGRSAPSKTDIGHVHLQVSDIDETIAFYRDALGLDLTGSLGSAAGFFSSNGYHHHIGANTWRSRGRSPAERSRAGLDRVVFAISENRQLTDLHQTFTEKGLDSSLTEGRLVVHDPDGIELQFVS